jgi:hypothetical protein
MAGRPYWLERAVGRSLPAFPRRVSQQVREMFVQTNACLTAAQQAGQRRLRRECRGADGVARRLDPHPQPSPRPDRNVLTALGLFRGRSMIHLPDRGDVDLRLRHLHPDVLERRADNLRDREIAEPFVIRRNDIPGPSLVEHFDSMSS